MKTYDTRSEYPVVDVQFILFTDTTPTATDMRLNAASDHLSGAWWITVPPTISTYARAVRKLHWGRLLAQVRSYPEITKPRTEVSLFHFQGLKQSE